MKYFTYIISLATLCGGYMLFVILQSFFPPQTGFGQINKWTAEKKAIKESKAQKTAIVLNDSAKNTNNEAFAAIQKFDERKDGLVQENLLLKKQIEALRDTIAARAKKDKANGQAMRALSARLKTVILRNANDSADRAMDSALGKTLDPSLFITGRDSVFINRETTITNTIRLLRKDKHDTTTTISITSKP